MKVKAARVKVDGVNKALLVVTEALPPDSSRPDVAVALFPTSHTLRAKLLITK